MKKILFPCLFLSSSLFFLAAQSQNLKALETNNGFKIYKLGSKYTSLYGIKNKDEDGADRVLINYTKDKIGEIPVRLIELFYLNDTLAKILVHVSPENNKKLRVSVPPRKIDYQCDRNGEVLGPSSLRGEAETIQKPRKPAA